MPCTSNEAFKCPGKYSKCAWCPCKFFCSISTFLPFPVFLSSHFQEQAIPEATSHINMRCKQTCPALSSPFGRCWGQTARKKSLKKTLVWTAPVAGFWECFPGLASKPETWQTTTSLGHCYSSSRAACVGSMAGQRPYRGNRAPQPLQAVFIWLNGSETAMGLDERRALWLLQWIPPGLGRKIAERVAAYLWVSMGSAEGGEKDLNRSQILNVLCLLSGGTYILLPLRRWILSYWTLCGFLCSH